VVHAFGGIEMVVAAFDEKQVGAHLSDAGGRTPNDQAHLHLGGMCAVVLVCCHERKADAYYWHLCCPAETRIRLVVIVG
jgi:hypothetical protein